MVAAPKGESMDSLKTYFVEVIIKKVGTMAILSGISSVIAFLVAHEDFMQKMGVTYYPDFIGKFVGAMPSGRVFIVEVETFQTWAMIAAPMVFMSVGMWIWHHLHATATGAPQSGDVRVKPEVSVEGGKRAGDQPQGESK